MENPKHRIWPIVMSRFEAESFSHAAPTSRCAPFDFSTISASVQDADAMRGDALSGDKPDERP